MPLLYDRNAVAGGYLGELIVMCAAYVTLGWTIIRRQADHVSTCASRPARCRCAIPSPTCPNRRAMLEWLTAATWSATRAIGLLLVDLDGFKDVNTAVRLPGGRRRAVPRRPAR